MELILTAGGYDFYRDTDGYWQCVRQGEKPPAVGAYKLLETLARMKNVTIPRSNLGE